MRVLGSRIGWAFVVGDWALWAAALWMRGGPGRSVALNREPILMNVLVFVDLAWLVLVSLALRGWEYLGVVERYDDPTYLYITAGLLAGVQWYWFGYMLEKRRLR